MYCSSVEQVSIVYAQGLIGIDREKESEKRMSSCNFALCCKDVMSMLLELTVA